MKIPSTLTAGLSLSLLWMLAGCESRSISDSGYRGGNSWSRQADAALDFLTGNSYLGGMKALVTTKGQVTIPKALREQFGIKPGAKVDFVAVEDGIRLRKVVDRKKQDAVLGCLKRELSERSSAEWMDELRGPVELPPLTRRSRGKHK